VKTNALQAAEGYNITFTAEGFPEGGEYNWSAATSIGGNAATATISSASTNGVVGGGDNHPVLRATVTYSVGGGGAGCRSTNSHYTILAACPYTGSDMVAGSCYQAFTGAQTWRATINDARISGTATLHPTEGRKYYNIVRMPDNKWWFAENVNFQKDLTWEASAGSPFSTTTNGVPGIGHFWCPGGSSGAVTTSNRAGCNLWGALYTWETAMMVDGKYSDDTKANSTWVEPTTSYCTYTTEQSLCTQNAGRGTGNHGICPSNWNIPTISDWVNMTNIVETGDKSIGTTLYWQGTNAGSYLRTHITCPATEPYCFGDDKAANYYRAGQRSKNPYGMTMLMNGVRRTELDFNSRGMSAYTHTSTPNQMGSAWFIAMYSTRDEVYTSYLGRALGQGVRCVR
jgi:uncharacterized protein (TIGR02145 family)